MTVLCCFDVRYEKKENVYSIGFQSYGKIFESRIHFKRRYREGAT